MPATAQPAPRVVDVGRASRPASVLRVVRALRLPALGAFGAVAAVNLVAIAADPWTFPLGHERATIAFEGGPWTWLSVALLAVTAVVLVAATRARTDRRWWVGVAAVFVYLALDEGLVLHERFDDLAGTAGIEHYGWAIPGAVVVLAVAALFARWFLALEPIVRGRLLVAAAIFLGGALCLEVGAGLWQTHAGEDRIFFLITTIEETLEVAGPLLVIRALLRLAPTDDAAVGTPPPSAVAPRR